MEISPEENKIIGNWILEGKRVVADATVYRVHDLIKSHLKLISDKGWKALYQDPEDGRYWEHVYLQSELQAGGPPSLITITFAEAKSKY